MEDQPKPPNEVNEPALKYGNDTVQQGYAPLSGASILAMANQAKSGVSMAKVQEIADGFAFTLEQMAQLLHVSLRTLQRRDPADAMSVPISERILQLQELHAQGLSVFGEAETFQAWLQEPIMALGGSTPLHLLDTTFGVQLVSQALGRLAYGVFS